MMTLSDLLKDIRDSQKACEEDGRDSSIDGYAYLIRGRIYKKWADAIDAHITSREAKGDAKPVAWLYSWDGAGYEAERCVVADASEKRARERAAQFDAEVVPLYTHPAAQEAAKSVVPDHTRELACEGLDYFEKAGDAGDREYIRAIREWMAAESQTYKAMIAAVQEGKP
jgi:hypothetical protein